MICCPIYHWLSVSRKCIYHSRFALVIYPLHDWPPTSDILGNKSLLARIYFLHRTQFFSIAVRCVRILNSPSNSFLPIGFSLDGLRWRSTTDWTKRVHRYWQQGSDNQRWRSPGLQQCECSYFYLCFSPFNYIILFTMKCLILLDYIKFSSSEPKAHWWSYSVGRHPSSVRRQHFQTSPQKPFGQLKPNFMWSLHGSREQKFLQTVMVSWPR